MDAIEVERIATDWWGEGGDLARRIAAYAEQLRATWDRDHRSSDVARQDTADALDEILRRELNPLNAAS